LLEDEGDVKLERMMGADTVDAFLTPAGRQRVREGVRRQGSAVNIRAIINTMTGGTVQAVGSATNSDVSQVVNDPKMLKEALDTLGNQLIDAVKTALPESN